MRQRFPEIADRVAHSGCFGRLDRYRNHIAEGLKINCMSRVWCRLRETTGADVSVTAFHRHVRAMMPEALVAPNEVTVYRPQMSPREEDQIDFGYLGRWGYPRTGTCDRLWAFIEWENCLTHPRGDSMIDDSLVWQTL